MIKKRHIFFIILILCISKIYIANAQRTIYVVNVTDQDIWIGSWGMSPVPVVYVPNNGGGYLAPGTSIVLTVPDDWHAARIWGRTGCVAGTGLNGFQCATGDCNTREFCYDAGSGIGYTGERPATLAEFTFQPVQDFYDVSLLDGYNLPMRIIPVPGTHNGETNGYYCGTAGCVEDLIPNCPTELQLIEGGEVVGCMSACQVFGNDEYCCTGPNNLPETCGPTDYSRVFKDACPGAYSYAYDDHTSTYTCNGGNVDYKVVFGFEDIANIPPNISISNPTGDLANLNPITITANAGDLDGSVTQVQFFVNDVLIGTNNTNCQAPNTCSYTAGWTPPASGNYEIRAVARDNEGEVSTDIVNIYVGNPCPTGFADAGNNETICEGEAINLAASGGGTYNWNNGLGNGANKTVSPTVTTTYVVTVTDGACVETDEITITVNALPNADAGTDITICEGESTNLQASGGGAYTWDNGLGNEASQTVSPSVTTTYNVTVTTDGCSDIDEVTVTVIPSPTANAGNDIAICEGESANLSATGGGDYVWNNGLGAGADHVVNPMLNTTYTVTVTSNGCIDTDDIMITVNSYPTADAGPDITICSGEVANISATGGAIYNWDNGLGAGANQILTPTESITYTVTAFNGECTDTDEITVTVNELPIVDAGPDVAICPVSSAMITATGASTYTWDNGLGAGNSFLVNPEMTTTYQVTGTDANGCINTDEVIVSVFDELPVDAGADVAICENESTTITASGAITYSWGNGLGTGNSHEVNPSITTTYIVTGADGSGCFGTDEVTITVNSLPTADAGNDAAICLGQSSTTLSGTGGISYTWSTDNGLDDPNIANPIANPTITTTYQLTVLDANGCADTDEITVTVNDLPIVDAGVDAAMCPIGSITLTATGASTYTWDNGLGDGNNFVVNPENTTTYQVTGVDLNGCTNTDEVIISVLDVLPVDAGADIAICANESTTITAGGAITYSWDNGLGIGNSLIVSPDITTTYTVTGTDDAGCIGTDEVTITVNSLPTANAGNDTAICLGQSTVLSGSGGTAYDWNPKTGLINGSTPTPTATPDATVSYIMTATDLNGCKNSDVVVVTVNPLPQVNAGTDVAMCSNDSITLSASGASTYTWDNGLGAGNDFIVSPSIATSFHVTGTDINGCVASDQIQVSINTILPVNAGDDFTVCTEQDTILLASGVSKYEWDNGLGTGNPKTISPVASKTYTVTGTDNNGCKSIDDILVTVISRPVINAGGDITLHLGETTILNGIADLTSFVWTPATYLDDSTSLSPTFSATESGFFPLILQVDNSYCTVTDEVNITVLSDVIIPNVFTPNGDGVNDEWNIVGLLGYPEVNLKVFNRLGGLIYESKGINISPWNGTYNSKPMPIATYYYILNLGVNEGVHTGTVTLVR